MLQNSSSNRRLVRDSAEHIKAFSGAGANARILQRRAINNNECAAGIYACIFFFLHATMIARFL